MKPSVSEVVAISLISVAAAGAGGLLEYGVNHELGKPDYAQPDKRDACAKQLGPNAVVATGVAGIDPLPTECAPFALAFTQKTNATVVYRPGEGALDLGRSDQIGTATTKDKTVTYKLPSATTFTATMKAKADKWEQENGLLGRNDLVIAFAAGGLTAMLFASEARKTKTYQRQDVQTNPVSSY